MLRRLLLPFAATAVALFGVGCTPKIGNSCSQSTDCSQQGDRLCDSSQPDGYCTVFNCEPDTCPDSICVVFNYNLDPSCATADDGRWPRFERSFCMKPCDPTHGSYSADGGVTDPGDCRDYYECIDLSDPKTQNERRAQVVDTGAADGGLGYSVCMVQASKAPPVSSTTPPVCLTPDAGFPSDGGIPWTAYDGGAGGSGGAGGAHP